ncbi:hypothetical protein PIB30_047918 [Stylosanthes scabra]|uniref:Transmembrane protein n=1 Tax=Stylosanthes scabra TaxID=79078 RepID=A0ABU6TGK0_9FABA|nr:hypothetical protein [Stylosanthes scabra]
MHLAPIFISRSLLYLVSAEDPGLCFAKSPVVRRWRSSQLQAAVGTPPRCVVPVGSLSSIFMSFESKENYIKAESDANLHLHERVVKIETDCMRLKLLACMNIIGFVFCIFLMLVLLLKL